MLLDQLLTEETGNMDINEFIAERPFLYHLTDEDNISGILTEGEIWSTKYIAHLAIAKRSERKTYLTTKRPKHSVLTVNGRKFKIRDQRPISIKILSKSLTDSWTTGDFLDHLNGRVFMWPTLDRLQRHYNRYAHENPVILRFNTADVFEINTSPQFCSINSGATRCHPFYKGAAPPRGRKTFLPANKYLDGIKNVAEVTFPIKCLVPSNIWTARSPNGNWEKI